MALHFYEPDHLQIGIEPPYDAEPADWPFNIIKAYINGEITTADAIIKIATPVDELYPIFLVQADDSVYFIWLTFCAILPQIPYDHPGHDRLAKLVVELMLRPGPSGEPRRNWGAEHESPWTHLSTPECRYSAIPADEDIRWCKSEGHEYSPQYEADGAELGLLKIKEEWTRHHAFRARLHAAPRSLNYEKDALIAIVPALEEGEKAPEEISLNIPAAAVWILYAGEQIYTCRSEWGRKPPNGCKPAEGGPLWNGKIGFCPKRWALWKDRFQWVTMQSDMTDEAREMAGKAVEKMNEIESKDPYSSVGTVQSPLRELRKGNVKEETNDLQGRQ